MEKSEARSRLDLKVVAATTPKAAATQSHGGIDEAMRVRGDELCRRDCHCCEGGNSGRVGLNRSGHHGSIRNRVRVDQTRLYMQVKNVNSDPTRT